MTDSLKTITTSAKRFLGGTLISRVTGLVREIAMAAAFGTIPAVAAFWMAFRFANLLRRMLGEGSFHAAFIPRFEALRKDDRQKGVHFFYEVKRGLTFLLIAIVVVSEICLASCLFFGSFSPSTLEVLKLTMVMTPAIVFICLYGLNAAYLNCEKSFFISSLAPSALNIVWIIAVFLVARFEAETALMLLSSLIVIAFAAQWLVTVPRVKKLTGYKPTSLTGLKAFYYLLKPLLLGMCGVAAAQINSAIDSIFARIADSEGPAILWYALRVQQLPLALFGVALTGAILPPISRAVQQNDNEKYFSFLHFSLKKSAAFMIPATFFFFAAGLSCINIIYGHGEFSKEATMGVAHCLFAYASALFPMTLVLILGASYYACQNWKAPTLFSLTAVALNILFNSLAVFVFHLGAISIALSTSLSTLANCTLLILSLQKEGRLFRTAKDGFTILGHVGKICLISLSAYLATTALSLFLFEDVLSRNVIFQTLHFMVEAAVFATCVVVQAKLFNIQEILSLIPLRFFKKYNQT